MQLPGYHLKVAKAATGLWCREGSVISLAVPPGRCPNNTSPSTQVPTANRSASAISVSFNPCTGRTDTS